jgi:hypothetical protein
MLVGNLFHVHSVRNRGATPELCIAKCRLPVPGDYKLGAVQELGSVQDCTSEVGTVEHCFEKIRAVQTGTRQIGIGEVRSPEIGAAKVRP